MPPRNIVSKDVKEQILKRIKEDGVSIAQLAGEHGLKTHTIYQWISRTVTAPSVHSGSSQIEAGEPSPKGVDR